MRVERKIIHEGRVWYTVQALLVYFTQQLHEFARSWARDRWSGSSSKQDGKLLVSVESLLSYEQRKPASKKSA